MKIIISLLLLFVTINHCLASPTAKRTIDKINNSSLVINKYLNKTPSTYNFSSRFDQKDSVSYNGQTLRLTLINSLKKYMNSTNRATYPGSSEQALKSLNSFFIYDSLYKNNTPGSINGFSLHKIDTKGLNDEYLKIKEGDIFNSIYANTPSKNLIRKIAGNDNPLTYAELKGWSSQTVSNLNLNNINTDGNKDSYIEPEDLITSFFKIWAKNVSAESSFTVPNGSLPLQRINQAYITKKGLDLTQLTNKFLQGSIVLSQIANDYLSSEKQGKGLNVDNEVQAKKGAKNYTQLEHHWDEAFGYLGIARDVANYSDNDHKKSRSIDTNNDGYISIHTEKSLGGIFKNASRFDFISAELCKGNPWQNCKTLGLTEKIITALTTGRYLISERPPAYKKDLKILADSIVYNTEKTIAATSIHYLNWTIGQINSYGTEQYLFKNYAKFWSEMKGFALSFQFNPNSSLNIKQFNKLHKLLADKPVLLNSPQTKVNSYKADLIEARNIMAKAYNFSDFFAKNL